MRHGKLSRILSGLTAKLKPAYQGTEKVIRKISGFENRNEKRLIKLIFGLSLTVYFIFAFNHLGNFLTTDEPLWVYERIPQYWQALRSGDWERTYINDKPGVTLALISGVGLFYEKDPYAALVLEKARSFTRYDSEKSPTLFLAFRLPLVIFNGLFSIFLFWLFRRTLENDWLALWSAILIQLSPILIGISQITNPDALLWPLATASVFSLLAFLRIEEKKFVILSAFCLGFSVLAKYSAVILFPFLFLLMFLYFLVDPNKKEHLENFPARVVRSAGAYVSVVAGAIAIYALFVPAVFRQPLFLYYGTVGYPGMRFILWPIIAVLFLAALDAKFYRSKITLFLLNLTRIIWKRTYRLVFVILVFLFILVIANWMTDQGIIRLGKIQFDAKQSSLFVRQPIYKKFLLEYFVFIFSLSPLAIASLILLWFRSFFGRTKEIFLVSAFSIFILLFYASVVAKELLATIRYSIMLYPLVAVLVAIGIADFFSLKRLANIPKTFITVGIIIFSIASLWLISPYYFNYSNSLLPKKYLITDAWGYGGFEAAEYINSLPGSEKLVVWSDYAGVCEFVRGICVVNRTLDQKTYPIDYYIITRRGKIRYDFTRKFSRDYKRSGERQIRAKEYYSKNDPIWSLEIDGRPGNYIKVFKAEKSQ